MFSKALSNVSIEFESVHAMACAIIQRLVNTSALFTD